MTLGTGKRSYRACVRCRSRKSKCNFEGVGEPMKPPCVSCYYSGSKCIIPDRGRSRKYAVERADDASIQQAETLNSSPRLASSAVNDDGLIQREQEGEEASDEDMHEVDENTEMGLRNPSDALHILTRSGPATSGENRPRGGHQHVLDPEDAEPGPVGSEADSAGGRGRHVAKPRHGSFGERRSILDEYELTQIGVLHLDDVLELLTIYVREYHPYCPLVPAYLLGPSALERIRRVDFFLLTVILTIASRDSTKHSPIHRYCWNHAQSLLLKVLLAVPWTQTPRTVEGLLLLSEWLPHVENECLTSGNPKDVFREGRTTWSLVGQAVRLGYALRLDRAAFRGNGNSTSQNQDQNRLIWMFTYIADRQISVRLGQSFWSRGPSLSSNFTAKDFPTLHPTPGLIDENYALILQANLELTQILHNAHAVLYSSTERTLSMIHEGDYPRYLDDFMESATHWDSRWKDMQVSPNIKHALRLLYEYVCLYINAFSFHAVLTRASRPRASERYRLARTQPLDSCFNGGIMSSPDARYIIGAISTARSLLGVMNELDPKHTLRYLPSRYHLYGLYAAVFLHKALDADAIQGTTQKEEVTSLAQRFIAAQKEVSSTESHICHGYSDLLKKLWSSNGSKRVPTTHNDTTSSTTLVADTFPKALLQDPPYPVADSVGTLGCGDRMSTSNVSDLAALEGGTPDFTSFESYLFGSLWPELASVGDSDEQGCLDQDVQFDFNFGSVL